MPYTYYINRKGDWTGAWCRGCGCAVFLDETYTCRKRRRRKGSGKGFIGWMLVGSTSTYIHTHTNICIKYIYTYMCVEKGRKGSIQVQQHVRVNRTPQHLPRNPCKETTQLLYLAFGVLMSYTRAKTIPPRTNLIILHPFIITYIICCFIFV